MKIICENEQYTLENNMNVINEIYKKVNILIENKKVVFSHLIIDDKEVFENHDSYIIEHLNEIREIRIITYNIKQMVWETMQSIQEYLSRAIPALDKLVNEGYESFTDKTWNGINQLAEGMQWILQFKSVTEKATQQPINWSDINESITICEDSFTQLLEAVEAKDTTLISDILSYEISPAYISLKGNLEIALKDKEFVQDAN